MPVTTEIQSPRQVKTTTPTSTAQPLSQGARGPRVRTLQTLLVAAGFRDSAVDGDFGPRTRAALVRFQRTRGLPPSGQATAETLQALKQPPSGWSTPPRAAAKPRASASSVSAELKTPAAVRAWVDQAADLTPAVKSMLRWAGSHLHAPYAAVNPFRFGDVPWDGGAHKSQNGSGRVYSIARGATVFDCSGFVVAAFRQQGVDLLKHGLASTSQFINDTRFLKPVTRENLRPGDLILYKPHKGIGHVVIYMGGDRCIEARSGAGVSVNQVHWANVKTFRRVPTPDDP